MSIALLKQKFAYAERGVLEAGRAKESAEVNVAATRSTFKLASVAYNLAQEEVISAFAALVKDAQDMMAKHRTGEATGDIDRYIRDSLMKQDAIVEVTSILPAWQCSEIVNELNKHIVELNREKFGLHGPPLRLRGGVPEDGNEA